MSLLTRTPLRASGQGGFTLIEIMITLLLMAGILLTITQVLTGARRTRDKIHNLQDAQKAGPAILQRMEQDLRAIYTHDRDRAFTILIRDDTLSGADADHIDFVSAVSSLIKYREDDQEDFHLAPINEVGYHLRRRPDNDDFMEIYRREDFGVDDLPFEGGRYALLHDRVKGFNITVYRADGPEEEPEDFWDAEEDLEMVGLPYRIEIELTIELAPRLTGEQIVFDRRTLTYRHSFHFNTSQRNAMNIQAIPSIPSGDAPVEDDEGEGGGGEGTDDENGGDGNDDGGGTGNDGGDTGNGGGGDGTRPDGTGTEDNPFGDGATGDNIFGDGG
jgi:prepilin-type N-terminal cleavage/methylation domain-containing protein